MTDLIISHPLPKGDVLWFRFRPEEHPGRVRWGFELYWLVGEAAEYQREQPAGQRRLDRARWWRRWLG